MAINVTDNNPKKWKFYRIESHFFVIFKRCFTIGIVSLFSIILHVAVIRLFFCFYRRAVFRNSFCLASYFTRCSHAHFWFAIDTAFWFYLFVKYCDIYSNSSKVPDSMWISIFSLQSKNYFHINLCFMASNFKFVKSSIDLASSSTSTATLDVPPSRSAEDSAVNSATKLSASARRAQFQKSRRIMSAPIRPINLDDMKAKKKATRKKKVIRYDRKIGIWNMPLILSSEAFKNFYEFRFTCFNAPILSFVKLSIQFYLESI